MYKYFLGGPSYNDVNKHDNKPVKRSLAKSAPLLPGFPSGSRTPASSHPVVTVFALAVMEYAVGVSKFGKNPMTL